MISLMSYGRFGSSGTISSSASSVRSGSSSVRTIRRVLHVVAGQIAQQLLHQEDRVLFVLGREMGHAADGRVGHRAAQLLERHLLVRHRLDHVRSGDEHVAGVFHHEDEVGDRGGVDRAARARPHDHADLRDDA